MINNNLISNPAPISERVSCIQPGVFGATILRNGETIYLRMELLTQENAKGWAHYADSTFWMANGRTGGVLTAFMRTAGTDKHPPFDEAPATFGFTREEYAAFTEKVAERKKTDSKLIKLIEANGGGSNHIATGFIPSEVHYIVYASTNPNLSIRETADSDLKLAEYIRSYSDILITVGSHFTPETKSFHNRGIFRNPYWVLEGKYAGLSMLLHAMTGAVAKKFYPEMNMMHVKPLGSMQVIIKKHLQRGDGYVIFMGEKTDIKDLLTSPDDEEGEMNHIEVPALVRLFAEATQIDNASK